MTEKFGIPIQGEDTTARVELFKSWRSFENLFEGATQMDVITYCDSPEFVLDVFDDVDTLEHMEVCVGDIEDYRERLVNKPDLADRLERLRRNDELVIHLFPSKDVHTKLYVIEDAGADMARCVVGSANLSRNGWGKQANVGVVFETPLGSDLHTEFKAFYKAHKHGYKNEEFLEDLTDELDAMDDDRESVINLFVEGKTGSRDEVGEIHGKLSDHIDVEADTVNIVPTDDEPTNDESEDTIEDAPDGTVNLAIPLNGYSDDAIDALTGMEDYDATISNGTLNTTPGAFHEYHRETYGVPPMRVVEEGGEEKLKFGVENKLYRIDQPLPDDPSEVDEALRKLESYFETVDKYGQTNNPTAVKSHMMEALFHIFWAPFAHRHAAFYKSEGISDPGKNLPFLYVHGDSNAGKGTFAEYALGMVSNARVKSTQDADGFGKRRIRSLINTSDTTFPVVVDDITKKGVESIKEPLCNYWDNWRPDNRFPTLAFISNDSRPKKWFRNRAKVLHFDVVFDSNNMKASRDTQRLIDEENPLYSWLAHEYLNTPLDLRENGDTLAEMRTALKSLYAYAGRDLPVYFPEQPAERIHDIGRERWSDMHDRGNIKFEEDEELLIADFSVSLDDGYEVNEYTRDVPTNARARRQGRTVEIHNPEAFIDWLGYDPTETQSNSNASVLSKVTSLF